MAPAVQASSHGRICTDCIVHGVCDEESNETVAQRGLFYPRPFLPGLRSCPLSMSDNSVFEVVCLAHPLDYHLTGLATHRNSLYAGAADGSLRVYTGSPSKRGVGRG